MNDRKKSTFFSAVFGKVAEKKFMSFSRKTAEKSEILFCRSHLHHRIEQLMANLIIRWSMDF